MGLMDTFDLVRNTRPPADQLNAADVRVLERQGLMEVTWGGTAVLTSAGNFRHGEVEQARAGIAYGEANGERRGLAATLQSLEDIAFRDVGPHHPEELLELVLLGLIRVHQSGHVVQTFEGQKATAETIQEMLAGGGRQKPPYVE